MTDLLLPEKINKMIKNIPKPRLLYNKGISVGGFFRPYTSYSEYTKAAIFSGSEIITPVTARFSALLGDMNTPDTIRNIDKFEVRFFTMKGCYDMINHNIPIQFISDESKLLDFFDVFNSRRPFDGINKNKFWSFVANNQEALHAALHLYSSKCLINSFINIIWYSVNTIRWINNLEDRFIIRSRWVPLNNDKVDTVPLTVNTAEFIAGFEPDVAHNEIRSMISRCKFPKFELQVQILNENEDLSQEYYDPTILWDEKYIPYSPIGILLINKIVPDDKHNEICYLDENTVEGIELCKNNLNNIIQYIYKTEAMERGVIL